MLLFKNIYLIIKYYMTVINRIAKLIVFSFVGFFLMNSVDAQILQKRKVILMGSKFEIGVVAKDSFIAQKYIDSAIVEISRIENLISTWIPQTQISIVNKNAGIKPIKVDAEVFQLTKRALVYSKITKGAFDISFAAMDKIWKFDGEMDTVPTPAQVLYAVRNVGYQNIVLDSINQTIFLAKKGMKIDFGSIGKSYGAKMARTKLVSLGVKAGIINASGDICIWGLQPDGSKWSIGVTDPFDIANVLSVLYFKKGSIVTSGSYEKFVVLDGKRYSHIINPKTGYPAKGMVSVTVVGPDAEIANALSTASMVMGVDQAKKLFNLFPYYDYIMITDQNKKNYSKGIKLYKKGKKFS